MVVVAVGWVVVTMMMMIIVMIHSEKDLHIKVMGVIVQL